MLSKPPNLFFQIIQWTLIQKIKIPRPLSQATACNESNAFTFTLPLSEGRTGEAREPSDKTMVFIPPRSKLSLTSPMTFQVHLLFCYTSYSFISPCWVCFAYCSTLKLESVLYSEISMKSYRTTRRLCWDSAAYFFLVAYFTFRLWTWRQYFPPKRWWTYARLHECTI
jgi:hypothetical protein